MLAVAALSACTAVAADKIPADPAATDRMSATSGSPSPEAGEPAVVGDPLGLPPPVGRQRASADQAGPATASGAGEGEGTVVAHAVVDDVIAFDEPSERSARVATFANPTDRGGPLVFQAVGKPRQGWLEVLLPVRPNNTTGWIRVADVHLTRNPYRIEIDLDRYHLTVHRGDEVQLTAPVAIGQTDTPTPLGHFYLIELLRPPDPDGPYGTYAYGLSGYSDVLERFNGGEGVIGIHGTNQPELLGGPASHGCIRVHNDTITEMAGFLPLGTPVSIGRPVRSNGIS